MFAKIEKTAFAPNIPTMVWDGDCGFCKFWILYLQKDIASKVEFIPYQNIAKYFSDIPLIEFKKASRFIETDGKIYSGPDSAYRCFYYTNNKYKKIAHNWYKHNKLFTAFSDITYNFIAKHRSIMFTITKIFFGKNPLNLTHYWLLYILLMVLIIYLLQIIL